MFTIIIFISSCAMRAGSGSMPGSAPKQEAKPDKSEPVPGAEILIEQEPNDIQQPKK